MPRPDLLSGECTQSCGRYLRYQTCGPQTNVCDRNASTMVHIYPSVLQALTGWGYVVSVEG
jgi:hypothetical protein